MKHLRRIAAICIALCLLCGLCLTGYAYEVPDSTKKGSITVEMRDGGKAVAGGSLTIYRVGEVREDDGDFGFQKTPAMAEFSESYEKVDSPELAEKVAAFVKLHKIPAYAVADNKNGKVVFSDLEQGLYLVVQTAASGGYEPLNSFLVTIPMYEDGHYVYEANAEGKFELEQKPSPSTPNKPSKPTKLPQTGQLNWPVPVMAAAGIGLLLLGLALRLRGGRGQRNA